MTDDLPLTQDDVREMIALLDGAKFHQLDIQTTRFRLRLRREGADWTQEWDHADTALAVAHTVAETPAEIPVGRAAILAPLPGTFYRAPQPGAPPFVTVGDVVTADTVVGIIETMKLMNPVHAGCGGTLRDMLIDNAQAVDRGSVIMLVEPS